MLYSPSTKGFYSFSTHGVNIPSDAIEKTEDEYQLLKNGQAEGKIIENDSSMRPMLADPPPLTGDELIKRQIVTLEYQQTPRRIREATLGIDNGWLAGIEAQIEALRAQLGAA